MGAVFLNGAKHYWEKPLWRVRCPNLKYALGHPLVDPSPQVDLIDVNGSALVLPMGFALELLEEFYNYKSGKTKIGQVSQFNLILQYVYGARNDAEARLEALYYLVDDAIRRIEASKRFVRSKEGGVIRESLTNQFVRLLPNRHPLFQRYAPTEAVKNIREEIKKAS